LCNAHYEFAAGDTTSIGGFFSHFLRSEYGTLRLYSGNDADSASLLAKQAMYFSTVAPVRMILSGSRSGVGVGVLNATL
jgi:hypothetical protein